MTLKLPESGRPKLLSPLTFILFVATILGGGLASALASQWLAAGGAGTFNLAFFLGSFFAGLGWSLAETVFETMVFLVITGVLGALALIYLESGILRAVVIAFVCGFNIGKLAGAVHREPGS